MYKRITALAVLGLVALAAPAHAAPKLAGVWRVVAISNKGKRETPPPQISITIHFNKGGAFMMRMAAKGPDGKARVKEEKGTWKVKGGKLITVVKGKTEAISIKIKGKSLKMTKAGKGVLELLRIK